MNEKVSRANLTISLALLFEGYTLKKQGNFDQRISLREISIRIGKNTVASIQLGLVLFSFSSNVLGNNRCTI